MMVDQSLLAALCVNVLSVNMLLSGFFLPGESAGCGGLALALLIKTPANMEALRGSCLQIPCSFSIRGHSFDSWKQTSAVWIRGDKDIFDSSNGVNDFPMKIYGNLRMKSCSTLFNDTSAAYKTEFFLRVENGKFKATGCPDPLLIKVRDCPWSPNIVVPSELRENQSVTLTCSAVTPCPHSPPELTWNPHQDSHRQIEENTDGTFTTKIQQSITLSASHDGLKINCSARYPVNEGTKTAETAVTLSVSYAPKDTSASISPSGLVSAGSWVELSCSSRAKPPISSFTWFKSSKDGAVNVSVGQIYSFNVTEGGEFYCEAANDLGTHRSAVIQVRMEEFGVRVCVVVKVLGILLLCSVFILFECWIRFSNTSEKNRDEADCVHRVIDIQASGDRRR